MMYRSLVAWNKCDAQPEAQHLLSDCKATSNYTGPNSQLHIAPAMAAHAGISSLSVVFQTQQHKPRWSWPQTHTGTLMPPLTWWKVLKEAHSPSRAKLNPPRCCPSTPCARDSITEPPASSGGRLLSICAARPRCWLWCCRTSLAACRMVRICRGRCSSRH